MFDYGIAVWRQGCGYEEASTLPPASHWSPTGGKLATKPASLASEPLPSVHISPCTIIRRRTAAWSNFSAELIQTTQSGMVVTEFHGPWHLLVAYEDGSRQDGEATVDGGHRSKVREMKGKLTFVPAGHHYSEWYQSSSPLRVVFFFLDPQSLSQGNGRGDAATSLVPKLSFEEPTLWSTASKITGLIERNGPDDRSYLNAVGSVLLHEVRRANCENRPLEPLCRGGLAAWQRRVAIDYIESHIDEQVSLATLAALVRLSPQHFCRAFRQSAGQPPGRFHGHRRIERAKLLLGKGNCSVTEVGLSLGYSETSSFTTAFRRATGLTPTEYRRSFA